MKKQATKKTAISTIDWINSIRSEENVKAMEGTALDMEQNDDRMEEAENRHEGNDNLDKEAGEGRNVSEDWKDEAGEWSEENADWEDEAGEWSEENTDWDDEAGEWSADWEDEADDWEEEDDDWEEEGEEESDYWQLGLVDDQESDDSLLDLMDYYVLTDRNRFCQEHGNGNVKLEPTLHMGETRQTMDLKIGITQMYVVKDIEELVENIKEQKYVSYGKKLAFTHSQSAFTREAVGLVNILLEMDSDYSIEQQYDSYARYMYTYSSQRRQCTLSPMALDQLMELYEGKELRVDDPYTEGVMDIPIIRENPRLPIRIKRMEEGGASVELDSIFLMEGGRQWYILWKKKIYICTNEYYERVKGFLKLMNEDTREYAFGWYVKRSRRKKISLYLHERDFGTFSKNVLPAVSDILKVTVKDLDLAEYEPAEPQFHCYLDKIGDHIECQAKVSYGDREYDVARIATKEEGDRDIRQEFEVRTLLEGYFELARDGVTYIAEDEKMMSFLETGVQQLERMTELFATDRFKALSIIPMPKVTTGISVNGRLLDVSWDVEGMDAREAMELLQSYRLKKKYHKLRSGEILKLDENSLAVLSELVDSLHLTKEELKAKKAQVPLYRSLYLDTLMRENANTIKLERDKEFKRIVRELRDAEDGDLELPKEIHAQLRPYQEIGFQWMGTLAKYGFGGILADDMGLGKTLQVLTLLAAHPGDHALVVCPSSLVYNWEAESHRFYPSARIAAVAGTPAARKEQIEAWKEQDILVTSYDLLKRDIDFYEGKQFDYVFIDEAQYIKNAGTQAAKSVKAISCGCRFALTGTPIENRLGELWSIFEFLMPGYLFSYKRFKEELESPIVESKDEGARTRLARMVKPFILRRLKKDVLKELPDKVEKVVYAQLSGEQQKLYQAREKKLLLMLAGQSDAEFKNKKLQILAELTGLRQLCCDPALVYEDYQKGSAKTETCLDTVENAVTGGHKVLLFSQFATMLERLKELLEQRGLRVLILTGKTSKEERRRLVGIFQDGEADVFLISLKAGGTGLNLTAADMVVHYDPWWNLAAQNQATDRAYRIGQDNKVTVVRLIMRGTIEERILKMQETKQNLADSIISEDGVSMAGLDKQQLLAVLEDSV